MEWNSDEELQESSSVSEVRVVEKSTTVDNSRDKRRDLSTTVDNDGAPFVMGVGFRYEKIGYPEGRCATE